MEGSLTWKRSRAMAVMLIVDTNTLAPEHIGTNLHMNHPSRQAGINTFSRLNGCVKRQKVKSEMARLMMKMFRGVLMAGFRATTKHTRLLPAAPNAINSANRVIRTFCKNNYSTHSQSDLLRRSWCFIVQVTNNILHYQRLIRSEKTNKMPSTCTSHWKLQYFRYKTLLNLNCSGITRRCKIN